MGVFDLYRDGDVKVQIKVNNGFDLYELHQACPLGDGIYIGHEGAVAVRDGKVAGVFRNIYTKWGDRLESEAILRPYDAVADAVAGISKTV